MASAALCVWAWVTSSPGPLPGRVQTMSLPNRDLRHRIHIAIGRPRRLGRPDQPGERHEHVVVVDAPAREVAPGLIPVGLEGQARSGQLVVHVVVLLTAHADRVGRRGMLPVGYPELVGDGAQAVVAGPAA